MKAVFIATIVVASWITLSANGFARAAAPLTERLQQLPPSVGENALIDVQPGESCAEVGEREHVGYEHIMRCNPHGFGPGKLFIAGRHNLSTSVRDGIVINIPEMMLYYFAHGQVARWYPVSVGMVDDQWHTITGNFSVGAKEADPTWRKPDFAGGGTMPPGPTNPLGDRLIDLNIPYYGLHGTNNPSCIGKLVSHGCIRMFPADIRELFDLVEVGTPLDITYQTLKIGQQHGVVYLAIFPDIYGKGTNGPMQARAALADYGLSGAVSDLWLQKYLARADGVARPILGSTLSTVINGAAWQGAIGPTLRDGVAYLPLGALADATGADIRIAGTEAIVRYQGRRVSVPIDEQTAFSALDTLFISVPAYAGALGGSASVNEQSLTITVPKG